jgi:mediator of RNA polymerase II transcription subunit 30
MQANQPQVMQQAGTGVAPTPPVQAQQQQQQSKEFNTASLCRIGQETVQDIVSRTQEVFQTLKTIQVLFENCENFYVICYAQAPNGTPQSSNASNEKKAKVQEQLRTIRVLFKRLRLIYEKCNENCQLQGMEYTHIESLIPFKDEHDPKHDEKKNSEAYRLACEECKEVMEQVILKNKQLKDVIDHLRRMIWEINTMLTMRRS